MSFKFALKETIKITCSNEQGEIIGRAEYSSQSNSYYILYKAADGRAVIDWWLEKALERLTDNITDKT